MTWDNMTILAQLGYLPAAPTKTGRAVSGRSRRFNFFTEKAQLSCEHARFGNRVGE